MLVWGGQEVGALRLGEEPIERAYLGDVLVHGQNAAPPSPRHSMWNTPGLGVYPWQSLGDGYSDRRSTLIATMFAIYTGANPLPAKPWRLRKVRFYVTPASDDNLTGNPGYRLHYWGDINRGAAYLNSPRPGQPNANLPDWSSDPFTVSGTGWQEVELPVPIDLPMGNTADTQTVEQVKQFGVGVECTQAPYAYQAITGDFGFTSSRFADDGAPLVIGDIWSSRLGWYAYTDTDAFGDWITYYSGVDVVVDEG